MKRKLFAGLLICILLVTLITSCNETAKPLVECGEEVISLMAEMLESEDYKSLYNLSAEHDETISKLREGNYSKSITVYELVIPEEELFDKTVNKENLSEDLYKYICSSAYVSFASRINIASDAGVEALSATTVFTAQKSFTNKNMDINKIYLYVFENGCPVAVTFVSDGDDTFRAIGNFIINDTFATDDDNSIKESCEALGINDVTVKRQ